jgi:hypothetical protein
MKMSLGRFQILNKLGSLFFAGLFIWGLLFAGWSAIMVVAGYWVEEVLTFVLTGITLIILRLLGRKPVYLGKFLFFLGTFLVFHTIFILILAGAASKTDPMALKLFEILLYPIAGGALELDPSFINAIANISLLAIVSVLYGIFISVIYKGKWRNMDIGGFVNASFKAFIAPHLIILFGIAAIIFLKIPNMLAIVLVIIKVFIDISGFGAKGGQIVDDH